jgi:hypothetical protein
MHPARPTTYRGIPMRSRTEARYARQLDDWFPGAWRYEPRAFKDLNGEWLPDFGIEGVLTSWSGRSSVYVEVKPGRWFDEVSAAVRSLCLGRIASIFESIPEAVVILEQSGAPGGPILVRLVDGQVVTAPVVWVKGSDGVVLCAVEASDWAAWDAA